MNTATPDSVGRAAGRPARKTQTPTAVTTGGSGLFVLLWLLFLAALIFDPTRLDAVWSWFRDLPIIVQVAGWVLLLPLMIGLAIWQAPWALWIRVTLIVLLAVANLIIFSPRTTYRREP